jgi:hypothetical protein
VQRLSKSQVVGYILGRQNTQQLTSDRDRQRSPARASQPRHGDVGRFARLRDWKLPIHGSFHGKGGTLRSQSVHQRIPTQHSYQAAFVHDREIMLPAIQQKFGRARK